MNTKPCSECRGAGQIEDVVCHACDGKGQIAVCTVCQEEDHGGGLFLDAEGVCIDCQMKSPGA